MLAHRDRDPHRLACACLCVSALFSWTLALAGLSSLVLVACSPAGRADAMLLLGGGEGDPEGAGVDAFVACGREYKLRWWTLFAHAGVWAGCAWAVAAGGRGRRQQHKQELQQGDGPDGGKAGGGGGNYSGDGLLRGAPPPPPPRLWPPPSPPFQPGQGTLPLTTNSITAAAAATTTTTALPPPPAPPRSLFAARAAALSPLACAAFLLAVLCADADLDSGATTAPGVMEWWYELSRGSRPFASVQARKYASVQAAAAGWVLLAACDAAWAWAQVAFCQGGGGGDGDGGDGGAAGGAAEVDGSELAGGRRARRQHQRRQHRPAAAAAAASLDRLEVPSSGGGGGGGSGAGSSSGLGGADACVRLEISGAGGVVSCDPKVLEGLR